jgi:hypothetical protein
MRKRAAVTDPFLNGRRRPWDHRVVRRILGFVGGLAVVVSCTQVAGATLTSSCYTDPPSGVDPVRFQGDELMTRDAIVTSLGTQDGTVWVCMSKGIMYVGGAPGPVDLATATATVSAVIAQRLGPAEAAWFTAHTDVRPVPYSRSTLDQTVATVFARGPRTPAWSVGETVVDYPIVEITLNNARTDLDVALAQQIVSEYGGEVTLQLSDSSLAQADGAGAGPEVPPPPQPRLSGLAYRRANHRLTVTITPGTLLSDATVMVRSPAGKLLSRSSTLHRVFAPRLVSIALRSRPTHIVIELRGHTTAGATVTARLTG